MGKKEVNIRFPGWLSANELSKKWQDYWSEIISESESKEDESESKEDESDESESEEDEYWAREYEEYMIKKYGTEPELGIPGGGGEAADPPNPDGDDVYGIC